MAGEHAAVEDDAATVAALLASSSVRRLAERVNRAAVEAGEAPPGMKQADPAMVFEDDPDAYDDTAWFCLAPEDGHGG